MGKAIFLEKRKILIFIFGSGFDVDKVKIGTYII